MEKILLADDDEVFLEVYTKALKKAGYEVVQARDGEEALNRIKTENPDLLLLDVVMPKKDGFTVAEEARTNGRGNIPVIFLTSQDVDDKRLKAINSIEPIYYLIKGEVELDDLLSKVKEVLER